METMFIVLAFVAGLVLAAGAVGFYMSTKLNGARGLQLQAEQVRDSQERTVANLAKELTDLGEAFALARGASIRAETIAEEAVRIRKETESVLNELKAELRGTVENYHKEQVRSSSESATVKMLREQMITSANAKEELKLQAQIEFKNLAHEILEEKTKSFTTATENQFNGIIKPLKEQIVSFTKTIDEKYSNEAKERFSLQNAIKSIVEANQQLSSEASSLTRALKGDSKVQGDWGEGLLEQIFESAGLTEGRDYSTQTTLKNEEGQNQRPDFVVNLPGGRSLIVDAKVSLTAYSRIHTSETEEGRIEALKEHVASLKRHVNQLSDKHYQSLNGLNSPDFVFLFVPIEPAYIAAAQYDEKLVSDAWKKKIAIVTSTTLFSSMQIVASLWRLENQNLNAQLIAKSAAGIYDQFVLFAESFEKIGKNIGTAQEAFDQGLSRLSSGRGNLVKRIEALTDLGVSPKKRISNKLLAGNSISLDDASDDSKNVNMEEA